MNAGAYASAFEAAGISYRTESDGSLIADCPVCEFEGKGKDKLKVYADGNLVCYRFNGNDQGEHKRQILAAWNMSATGAPAPKSFLSETILDGKLTLEIQRGDRNKQTVTARNCDSVLNVDFFNLADSVSRTKFVNALELAADDSKICVRSLINLADRFQRVNDAAPEKEESEAKPVSFVVLSNGRRAELTTRGFAVYNQETKETIYESRLVDEDSSVYIPSITAETAHKIGLFLPSAVEEYYTDEQLDADILKFIEKYVDIDAQDRAICAKYPRVTYRVESLQEIPYLRAVGDSGNGKSRLTQTVGLLCYRPIFTVGITPAALFRTIDAYKPTLILDEFNVDVSSEDTAAILQVLNSGYQRITRVIRCSGDRNNLSPEGFDPFGPKILAGLKYTKSPAFESRTHPVRMEETTRNDIPLQLLPEMLAEAESIRNKLTLWRLRTFNDSISEKLKEAEQSLKDVGGIKKRLIQISIPLYAMLDSEQVKANFVEQLKERTKDAASERSQTIEGQIVEVIHSRLFFEDETGNWNFAEYDSELVTGQEGKPDERLTTKAIAEEINANLPDRRKHTVEYVGKVLTNSLHLKTDYIKRRKSSNYQKRAVVFNHSRFDTLFKIYRLHLPSFFTTRTTSSDVIPNLATLNLSVDGENEDIENEHLHSVQTKQAEHLSGVSVVSVDDSAEETDKSLEVSVDEVEPVTDLPDYMQNCIALDTETEVFDKRLGINAQNAKAIGISLCYDGSQADYITDKDSWGFCLPDEDKTVIFHNAKFDLGVLERAGLPLPENWEDTLIAAHLLDEAGEHGLKPLAKKRLGIDNPETFEEVNRYRLLDPERFENYAKNDARYTFRLWQQFKPELEAQGLTEVYELEKRIVPVVRRMESVGMQLDVPALEELNRFIKAESERLTSAIYEQTGCEFDLHSPQKTAVILYDKLGLNCPKETAKGSRSVDAETLKELEGEHPVIALLLELRQMDKLASTFTTTLLKMKDEGGRIKAEFNQLGAMTGRFTCRKPNLQQVPSRSELGKRLRSCFVAPMGKKLIVADFSQMKLRVLAHFSQDAELLKAFESNADLHLVTAQKMFKKSEVTKEERAIAKMINFGIAYGISARGLFARLNAQGVSVTETDCERFIETYFATYRGVARFLLKVESTIKQRGFVHSLLGRRRRVIGATRREVRQAQNFVIQASAADLAKIALLKLSERLPETAQIISMIHDEFVIECESEIAEDVRRLTEQTMSETPEGFTVRMDVEAKTVDRWSDGK